MPSVVPEPKTIRPFASDAAFESWLSRNHDKVREVWIKFFKKASGKPSIDASQAIDVALCWGWIDGIRKPFDDEAFLQRYTPRGPKSRWSQINVERVAKLTKAGRMTPHGQRHIDAAKDDGRWDAAYASPKAIVIPDELLEAVSKKAAALKVFQTLNRANTFALAYRLHHIKTPEGRARFISTWVDKLARGQMPHPQSTSTSRKPKKNA